MIKTADLGIFFGESFYELALIDCSDGHLIASDQKYAPKSDLTDYLKVWLEPFKEFKFNQAFVGLRYLEKLFNYKIGGSVAQIVLKKEGQWPYVFTPSKSESYFRFELPPDASSINSIHEISENFSDDEINLITEKLQKTEMKRICLNIPNDPKYTMGIKKIETTLIEKGFEVFYKESNFNDFNSYRSQILEASLTGTFRDKKSEIIDSLKPWFSEDKVYFSARAASTSKALENINHLESVVFSKKASLSSGVQDYDVLHLGTENFSVWLNAKTQWQSPWGLTDLETPKRIDLGIQPTNSFYLNSFEDIDITKSEETFEPGPMFFGRGRIPCVYDLLNWSEKKSPLGKRIHDSFWAIVKCSNNRFNPESCIEQFQKIIVDRICVEACSVLTAKSERTHLIVWSHYSELFKNRLTSLLPSYKITFVSLKDLNKAHVIANYGRSQNNE